MHIEHSLQAGFSASVIDERIVGSSGTFVLIAAKRSREPYPGLSTIVFFPRLPNPLKPHELAKAISRGKALAVASKHQNAIIIAADTFVVCRGKIMAKPGTEAEARVMLRAISGRAHSVITGFTILDTGKNKILSQAVETIVHVKQLSSKEIDAYVRSGEPIGKAGAYEIQGLGSVIIEKIEGDYFNVVGLPLSSLAESLKKFGVHILL